MTDEERLAEIRKLRPIRGIVNMTGEERDALVRLLDAREQEIAELRGLYDAMCHAAGSYSGERDAARAQVAAMREKIGNRAREIAGYYKRSSDGWNTFLMFADWIERDALTKGEI